MAGKLYTIGHSIFPQEEIIQKLKDNHINILVDVRSTPYSRYAPQFNKTEFQTALEAEGIAYVHEPEAFGARRDEAELYNAEGYVDFDKVRATDSFQKKSDDYIAKAKAGKNIAFMCTEKDPIDCHRAILVARGLALKGQEPQHIMPSGKVVSQKALDERLIQKFFPENNMTSLFPEYENSQENHEDILAEAYALQNKEVGYKMPENMKIQQQRNDDIKKYDNLDENGIPVSTDKRIGHFRKEYMFLSNMYNCPVTYKGVTYKSSESAYQAQRMLNESDKKKFVNLSGFDAKKLVNKLPGRKDWHEVNTQIMREILYAKFEQNKDLADKLVATGSKELIEGNNWHDQYWGVFCGEGKNMLGKLLMEVRSELVQKRENNNTQAMNKGDAVMDMGDKEFVISVTGHRPNKLFGYEWNTPGNQALMEKMATVLKQTLDDAKNRGYHKFRVITGMALGVDQMFMAQAQKLAHGKGEYAGVLKTEAAIPCQGQESKWIQSSKDLYNVLLSYCDKKTLVTKGAYTPRCMQVRNEYMVDKCNVLLSVYDGTSGGTKNCIDYAKKKGVPVIEVGLPELLKQYSRQGNVKGGNLKPKGNNSISDGNSR